MDVTPPITTPNSVAARKENTMGILREAVSLEQQAFLCVIGNVSSFSRHALSLLPLVTRKKLFRHLSAYNLHRLEGTRVSIDIDTYDIWGAMYCTRIPSVIQNSLKDLLSKVELEKLAVDLTWKEKYLMYCFDMIVSARCMKENDGRVVFAVEACLFGVWTGDSSLYSCLLPNNTCFNLQSITVPNWLIPSSQARLFSDLLTPVPPNYPITVNDISLEKIPNILSATKFFVEELAYRPTFLGLHDIFTRDVSLTLLWPALHLSSLSSSTTHNLVKDFFLDVDVVYIRARSWNSSKNDPVLQLLMQVLAQNRRKCSLRGFILDIANLGTNAQIQMIRILVSCLQHNTGIAPLKVISMYLDMTSSEELVSLMPLLRQELHLEMLKVFCNHNTHSWDPSPIGTHPYNSLCGTFSALTQMSTTIRIMQLHQVNVSTTVLQRLILYYLTSTNPHSQLLTLSCIGLLDSPHTEIPVPQVKDEGNAGINGARDLCLRCCHFSLELSQWMTEFPYIRLNALRINTVNSTDNMSALKCFSQMKNLDVKHVELKLRSNYISYNAAHRLLGLYKHTHFKTTTADLLLLNVTVDNVPSLVTVIQQSSRVFIRIYLHFVLNLVKEQKPLYQVLEAICKLPYIANFELFMDCPGLTAEHVKRFHEIWCKATKKRPLSKLCITGPTSTCELLSQEQHKKVISKMCTHLCDPDTCNCISNSLRHY